MKIVRWILVLPGAAACSLLAQILFSACWPPGWQWTDYVCQLWNSVLPTAMFVIVGAEIAPRFHRETALVITTLYCAVCGVLVVYAIQQRHWWILFCLLVNWATVISACVLYWRHRSTQATSTEGNIPEHPFGLN